MTSCLGLCPIPLCQALELGHGVFSQWKPFRSINWMKTKAGPVPRGYCFMSERRRLNCKLPGLAGMPGGSARGERFTGVP